MTLLSILSLVVSLLAVLVARENMRRQLKVAAQETWVREFRSQVADLISRSDALRNYGITINHTTGGDPEKEKRLAELHDALTPSFHNIRLLVAEKGKYDGFIRKIEAMLLDIRDEDEVFVRIPMHRGHLLRFDRGQATDLMAATIPI
jgi:hypothetical protein